MTAEPELTPLERRDRALARLDAGRRALRESLAGLDAEEAFLGSRWSVWEVLQHLDAESFVEALERIAAGEQEMLPPFTSREERLRQDLEHLDATHQRLRAVMSGLSEAQLSRPVTPPNPHNSFPGLTLLELIERVSGHAATHSRQVEATQRTGDNRRRPGQRRPGGGAAPGTGAYRLCRLHGGRCGGPGTGSSLDPGAGVGNPPRQPRGSGVPPGPGDPGRPLGGHLRPGQRPGHRRPNAAGPGPPSLRPRSDNNLDTVNKHGYTGYTGYGIRKTKYPVYPVHPCLSLAATLDRRGG